MLKICMMSSLLLISSCHWGTKSHDDEFLNLKLVQPISFKKNIDETWSHETRQFYAGYYFLLGEFLSLERNSKDSEPMLSLANELDPNEFLALKLVSAKISSAKVDEAGQELQKLILLYPRSAKFHYLYGSLLFRAGDSDAASIELEKAISLEPTDEAAYLQLTGLYQQQNRSDMAIQVCRRLTRHNPRSVVAWLALARLLFEDARIIEALEPAARAYQINSTNAETVLLYALLLEQVNRRSEAIKLYDELFSDNPSIEDLLTKTVALYKTFGDLEEVSTRLTMISEHAGGRSLGIEIQRALVLWELGKNQDALSVLLNLRKNYADSEQTLYLAALGFEKIGDLSNALSLYASVEENSKFYLPAMFQTLRILEGQKRFLEAYQTLHRVTKSRYVVSEIFALGANLYMHENRVDDAIALLKEGYAKFPDQIQLLFLVGVFQERVGRVDACVQTMKDVIHAQPNYSSALNYLGYIWAERGIHLDEAKILIERALSLKPDDGFYMDSLGWVHFQKKEYEKALEILKRASQIEAEEAVIVEHIGDVYLGMGRVDDAAKQFEEALKKKNLEPQDKIRIETKWNQTKSRKAA